MTKPITFAMIRAALMEEPDYRLSFKHALPLLEAIEDRAKSFEDYGAKVQKWLDGEVSTTFLRDEICEVVRNLPKVVEIGKQFNPTTEWHNTYIPLDSAAHIARTEPERIINLLIDKAKDTHYGSVSNYGVF